MFGAFLDAIGSYCWFMCRFYGLRGYAGADASLLLEAFTLAWVCVTLERHCLHYHAERGNDRCLFFWLFLSRVLSRRGAKALPSVAVFATDDGFRVALPIHVGVVAFFTGCLGCYTNWHGLFTLSMVITIS